MGTLPPNLIIAIDGPVAAGKTTVARLLAQRLGYTHIDSGAMYRALAWKAVKHEVDLSNPTMLVNVLAQTELELRPTHEGLRVLVDGQDVTEELRSPKFQAAASILSVHPSVREEMVRRQRELGKEGGVVMDGRDIGTVVFPDAAMKFYLTASLEERGRRRFRETPQPLQTLEITLEEVASRDRRDMERSASPLRPAPDAILMDTTDLDPEEVVRRMEGCIFQALKK